jgi:hypothetical protein
MKIRTVLYYDMHGKVVAAGAEEPPMDEGGVISDNNNNFFDIDAAEPLRIEWHVGMHASWPL